jgi:hypothetical protein
MVGGRVASWCPQTCDVCPARSRWKRYLPELRVSHTVTNQADNVVIGLRKKADFRVTDDQPGEVRSTVIDWTAVIAAAGLISTLTGTISGYVYAARNDEARDRRADQRETRARRSALAERLEEERHTFQRDTLLELQDVLLELDRWHGLVCECYEKALKEHRKLIPLPDELGGDGARLRVASAQRLRSRVLDPVLRASIGEFIGDCAWDSTYLESMETGAAIKELHRRDFTVATAYEALTARIGESLRAELDRRILVDEIERRL